MTEQFSREEIEAAKRRIRRQGLLDQLGAALERHSEG